MDPLIIFACIFVPMFGLNLLSAGRDLILFETRPPTRRWPLILGMVAAVMALSALGLSLPMSLALVLPGPLASGLGHWIGSGDWIATRHRLGRLAGRD
jgi:hypothetical protein